MPITLRTREDYDRAFTAVRAVIHAWDPHDLIHMGAPADEWDDEIARLVTRIPTIESADEAARAVSEVFSEAFTPAKFTPSHCAEVGERLYEAVRALE